MLKRFKDGRHTANDIDRVNHSCVVERDTELPVGTKCATCTNADRDAINTAVFEEHVLKTADVVNGLLKHKSAVLILADRLQLSDGKQLLSMGNCVKFWQECGEDDIKMHKGRMDPVVKLFFGSQHMLVSNDDVINGQANGTQAQAMGLFLKPGETAHIKRCCLQVHYPVSNDMSASE